MSGKLTHVGEDGTPRMVDVSPKQPTTRNAVARSSVTFPSHMALAVKDGEIYSKKGAVFHTAVVAGVMAAKRTHELIPFCHPLGLEKCDIEIKLNENREAEITCSVVVTHKTGVEMEALTGASVAALTIYDMCKALGHGMVIRKTRLLSKSGGKNDYTAA